MGGFEGILKYLPGMSGLKEKVEKSLENEDVFKKQKAIITSMTKRKNIQILKRLEKIEFVVQVPVSKI